MKSYSLWKFKFYRLSVLNQASGLLQIGHKLEKLQKRPNLLAWRHRQYFWRCFVSLIKFSCSSKFHVNIITDSGVRQFSFIRDWPKIWKLEILPSEFCPISGNWDELEIPNLERMSLVKYYWMLQNARVTAFTVSELPTGMGEGGKMTPFTHTHTHTHREIRFKYVWPFVSMKGLKTDWNAWNLILLVLKYLKQKHSSRGVLWKLILKL